MQIDENLTWGYWGVKTLRTTEPEDEITIKIAALKKLGFRWETLGKWL